MFDLIPLMLAAASDERSAAGPPAILVVRLLAAVVGFSCLTWCLAPDRHARAAEAFRVTAAHLLRGSLLLLVAGGLAVWAVKRGTIGHGGGLLVLPFLILLGIGISTAARGLGSRALPDHPALAQFVLGLAAILLPAAFIILMPISLLAGAVGLGVWMSARR